MSEPQILNDPRVLRALAHPVRRDILYWLKEPERQLGGELFGKATGDDDGGRAGGQVLGQRVEVDDVGPGGREQFPVLGVAEAEGPPGRQRHRHVADRFGHRRRHLELGPRSRRLLR